MLYAQVHLTLPAWIHDHVDASRAYPGDAEKVALAIDLSRMNVEARSGGPFGAVVFGPDDRIIAAAVNRVVPQNTSLAHAENMAYMLAQQRLQTPRLNDVLSPVTLATSAQPCCQCYGATVWAGIDRLLIGARRRRDGVDRIRRRPAAGRLGGRADPSRHRGGARCAARTGLRGVAQLWRGWR